MSGSRLPWLAERRITVPDRVADYVHRAELVERCMPDRRPLTLLQAPGGFGKTTVLAECCREAAQRGVPVAWLTLGDDDVPTLDTYLAFAFQRAGLDIGGVSGAGLSDRIALALRAVENDGRQWILALDEVERVSSRGAVTRLNELVGAGVANLHVAIACRDLPVGLNIALPVLGGSAEIVTTDHLRFGRRDIARLFEGKLSRRELAAVAQDSSGWPIALRIRHNVRSRSNRERADVVRGVVENWVESRLWFDLSDENREFLLDVGTLEWIDEEMLDIALGGTNLLERLNALRSVTGLLTPVRGRSGKVLRLHPLIREYCAERRRQETPKRYRSIHRRIAVLLGRRGNTVEAMRHAAEALDGGLAGEILTRAGGVRLLLRQGFDQLIAADDLTTEETLEQHPRLAVVRALADVLKGNVVDGVSKLDAAERNLRGGDAWDDELDADLQLARALVAVICCESVGSPRAPQLTAGIERVAARSHEEPLMRASMNYALCQVHTMRGEFEAARRRIEMADQWLGDESPYLRMVLDLQHGQIAMAQGQVRAASAWYREGIQSARAMFLIERPSVIGEVLIRELELERNRMIHSDEGFGLLRKLWRNSLHFTSYAAAADMMVDLIGEARGARAALGEVEELLTVARRERKTALVRFLSGLRVSVLAADGRIGEAEARWREDDLPPSVDDCVGLTNQSWREMEIVACARLRLFTNRGDFDAGRRLVQLLGETTKQRGLRRTWMRVLALAITLEQKAGKLVAADEHLKAFLRLYVETDYARPLVRERGSAVPTLSRFLKAHPTSTQASAAATLLAASQAGEVETVPALSARERQVLGLLAGQTDNEIAAALGLTRAGVRYHVQHLFRKLHVRRRRDAVLRAHDLGLLVE